MDTTELLRRHQLISRAFRPAGPVDDQMLFAGRGVKLIQVLDAVEQPGQHGAIYGGRGVGKTSLAKVLVNMFRADNKGAFHYTCSTADTFSSIWRAILSDLKLTMTQPGVGFRPEDRAQIASAADLLLDDEADVQPEDVRRALTVLCSARPFVFFVDEFDRIGDQLTKTNFADAIKVLSDQLVPATLVLVGVADNIDELVEEHASVRRSLAQIFMPNMSTTELAEIVDKGMKLAEMTVDPAFTNEVVSLAQGLPNYVHLIAQNSARQAVDSGRTDVRYADLEPGITRSIEGIQQSVLDTYHRATTSNRDTLYKEVLLSCALAKRDERGTFGAVDVRDELRQVTGTYRELPAFAQHLNDFSGTGRRGGVLDRLGQPHSYRYRFSDPLVQPYVLMRGRIDGLLAPGGKPTPGAPIEPPDQLPGMPD